MIITKGSIVDFAVRKLVGDRSTSLTGIGPDSYASAVNDLEGMMARWKADGTDLFYILGEMHDIKAWSQQDSGLELWMMQPVAYNLALIIADDFQREPSPSIMSNASKGWRSILAFCERRIPATPKNPLPQGTGEFANTASPLKGFNHERKH